MDKRKKKLLSVYKKAGQAHVFKHYDGLSSEEKTLLLDQLESIEVKNIATILKSALNEEKANANVQAVSGNIKPFSGEIGKSAEILDSTNESGDTNNKKLTDLGLGAIRQNKVAAVLLAGGQGSRLGFDGPKGMYSIGLSSDATLFEMICKRILRLTQLASNADVDGHGQQAKARIPLYIMTSPMNHKETKEYFEAKDHFGMEPDDIILFPQGVLPCLSPEGKIILEAPYKCAMAPDGNGGIYPAMSKLGVIRDMKLRGVEHIHAFSVDNALVRPADPAFIGYCIQHNADCGNKVLWKSDPAEKVGIIAEKGGKPCVVEYSELSEEMASETEEGSDKLAFGAANICNHYYSLAFLQKKVIPNLGNMFHVARKKIGAWDPDVMEAVTPNSNNGLKLESFIFDVFPLSKSMAIYEVDRTYEFAPVKNAPGSASDSPDTARAMISSASRKWLEKAGVIVSGDTASDMCEISPLISYGGEGLEGYVGKGGKIGEDEIRCPFVLDAEGGVKQAPEPENLALMISRSLTGLSGGGGADGSTELMSDTFDGKKGGGDGSVVDDEKDEKDSEPYSIIDKLCSLPGSLASSLRG